MIVYPFIGGTIALAWYGLYTASSQLLQATNSKALKLVKAMRPDAQLNLWQRYFQLMTRIFEPLIVIDQTREATIQRQLDKAGFQITARQYDAQLIAISMTWVAAIIVGWAIGARVVCIGLVLMGLADTWNRRQKLHERIEEINIEVEAELPQFIRAFGQALNGEKDIVRILQKYRQISGPALSYELDILITDLLTGDAEEAFLRFDERINLPIITTFVSGVVGTTRGVDNQTFFYILEHDIKLLAHENLQRALAKRPATIARGSLLIFGSFMIMMVYPVIMLIVDNLKIFK